ncbi:isoprenylcysteine carboxylmethyltransferase family protein [Clostridium chromiireducens]|uniref:Isoprenylcysteine carboxylmethyltransferase family protein n=1 Tax=Clostridium chromiireducens TaxID=225345 RepID=A0A399IQ33_9CLOT|nr:isoprenylcysteine carboxylmethyltransferase family protein [Clostridium chromiireducens]RII33046.1 isoprenylcysteine carboxylmethyltransferase family protein [Clostridium chromiireducens]
MYLFGASYFETAIFKEVFQVVFILYIMAEVFIFSYTSLQNRKNLNKKKGDKGSCLVLVLGIIAIIFLNLFCKKNYLLILSELMFWIGCVVIIVGIILRLYSVLTLGKSFTVSVQVDLNQKIIQTGPYKYIRHPAYSGSILSLIGIAFAFRSIIGIIETIIIIAAIYGYRIKIEEKILESNFKTDYQEYKTNTKRIIPFIW